MIQMPWSNSTAPNVMIEVVDHCNVSCKACYRNLFKNVRSLEQIETDLNDAMRLRDLHTVTLSGGEPTLHPDLCSIVRMVKAKGLHVFLLTNGLLINFDYITLLKEAGLDSILFHVDLGQKRKDLPRQPTFADVRRRLDELIDLAASAGLDASISTILYEEGQEIAISRYFLENKKTTFLFLSKAVSCSTFFRQPHSPQPEDKPPTTTQRIIEFFHNEHGIEPFAFIPTLDGKESVWISYFIPIVYHDNRYRTLKYRSTWIDAAMMRIVRRITGHHIHKTTQKKRVTLARILLNAASHLSFWPAFTFLLDSIKRGSDLRHKTIVYDDGPYHAHDHSVQHCEYCPTAIVRDGRLLPCCTADFEPQKVPT